jgi:hypothetical protein
MRFGAYILRYKHAEIEQQIYRGEGWGYGGQVGDVKESCIKVPLMNAVGGRSNICEAKPKMDMPPLRTRISPERNQSFSSFEDSRSILVS